MHKLHGMATAFAKEIVEHHLKCGATTLNTDYISDQACELAYKIDKRIKEHVGDDYDHELVTNSSIKNILHEYTVAPKAIAKAT